MIFQLNVRVVEFPDPNFRNVVLELISPIDTNGAGEIQFSKADACYKIKNQNSNF